MRSGPTAIAGRWTTPVPGLHTYAPDGGLVSKVGLRRRNRLVVCRLKRDRCQCADRERHGFADVRNPGSQVGRHLLIHVESFVLGVSRSRVLVLRQHQEVDDQSGPIDQWQELQELIRSHRASERRCTRLVCGLRHGCRCDFNPRVHHLHDQVGRSHSENEPIAEPKGNSTTIAYAVRFDIALAEPIAAARHGQRVAFAYRLAGFRAATGHRRRR